MFKYAVVKIAGKQYTVKPDQELKVNSLGDVKELEVSQILMLVGEDGKIQVGTPYLSDSLKFDVISSGRDKKIRVAKFHAKANYRRVRGSRAHYTVVSTKSDTAPKKTIKKAEATAVKTA